MNTVQRPGRPAWKRVVGTMLIVAMLVFSVGCYGSFPLTHAVYEFNGDAFDLEIADRNIGQQLLFWVFVWLPVYGIAMLGDAVIFNLIEFWTGNALEIGDATTTNGQYETAMSLSEDGTTLTMTTMENGEVVAQMQSIEVAPGTFEMRDASGAMLGSVHRTASGDLELSNASGRMVHVISAAQVAEMNTSAL